MEISTLLIPKFTSGYDPEPGKSTFMTVKLWRA
jgi:hypothetical protein